MLSIVSTPIGNLGDITVRAIETMTKCDLIVCEDTRVAGHLLSQLKIPKKDLMSFHGYSDAGKLDVIARRMKEGSHVVLVSDAGTPAISDPGYAVVRRAIEEGVVIEVIPGAAAFLAALSGSGLPIDKFVYLGFLPLKKGRKTLFDGFKEEERTIVFYESVHRIEKTLCEIADALSDQPDRPVVIARELTKMHEEFIRVTVAGLKDAAKNVIKKGEFAVVIGAV